MKYIFSISLAILATLLITIAPVTADNGTLEITNLSSVTYNFTLQQLKEIPKTTVNADLFCYGKLLTSGEWGGVQLSNLLNQTEITPEVNSIAFLAADGYAVSIPIQVAQSPQTIIAYEKDGQSLPEGLRLVLPGYNGASWIAQIESITLSNNEVLVPASISIDGSAAARSLLSDITGRLTSPQPTLNPPSPTSIPKPSPVSPTPTPVPPTNNTTVEPTAKPQVESPQTTGLDIRTVAPIAVALVVGLAIAILTYNRRTKPKESIPQRINL